MDAKLRTMLAAALLLLSDGRAAAQAIAPKPQETAPPAVAAPAVAPGDEVKPNLELRQLTVIPSKEEDLLPMFPAKRRASAKDKRVLYQLRCWQHGVLLFSDNEMSEPNAQDFMARAASNAKTGKNAHKLGLDQTQVFDYVGSLCVIKRHQ